MRNTLITAAATASIVSAIVTAVGILLLTSGFNDANQISTINLCDGGNITRAYLWSDARQSGANRDDRVARANALLPIRDCGATAHKGVDVIVSFKVSNEFRELVSARHKPLIRNGRIVAVDGKPR